MSNLNDQQLELIQELIRKELLEVRTNNSLMERQLKKDLEALQEAVRKELREKKVLKRIENIGDIFDVVNLARKIERTHALSYDYALKQALDILGFEVDEQEVKILKEYDDKDLFEKVHENKTYTLSAEGKLTKITRERIERLDVRRVWEVIGIAYIPEKKGNVRTEYVRLVTCLTPEKAEERRLVAEQQLVPNRFRKVLVEPKDIKDEEIDGIDWWL